MIIYICLLIYFIYLLHLRNSSLYSNMFCRIYAFIFSFCVLFLIYVFKGVSVGTDYPMYHLFFYMNYNELKSHFIENGYILLNQFAQKNNMFLIIPIIIFLVIFFGCYLLSRELGINRFTFLSFLVLTYFYLFTFNALRQFLALGIVCFGLGLFIKYYKKKVWRYILLICLIIIAKQFHNSSVFCLIFMFLPLININSRGVFWSGIFTSFFYFNNVISNLFNKLLSFSPTYLQKYGSISNSLSFNKGIFAFIPVVIQFIFLFIFVYNNYNKFNYKRKFIISGYLMYLILYSASSSVIAERLQTFTYIFPLLFSCEVFEEYGVNESRINVSYMYKLLFIVFIILYYILRLITNNSGVVPYTFI